MDDCKSDVKLTVNYVKQYFNLNKSTLKRIREYLEINLEKKGKFLYFSEDDFNKIDSFLKENPNTRVFFQKQTFLKKYGVDNPRKLKSIKNKINNTIKEKYGVDNISQSEEIKNKKKITTLKNYGVENPSKNKEVLNKMFDTKLKKYDDKTYGSFSSDVHKKSIVEKYGVDNPMKNKEISNKSKTSKIENKLLKLKKLEGLFSVSELCQKYERCYDTMLDILKIKNVEIVNIYDSYYVDKNEFYKIEDYIKTSNSKRVSNIEKELLDFVKSIHNSEIIENDRKIINPLELDIYIPSKNVALEFNGIYYHSNKFKDKNYHYNKTKLCEEKGIRLIHVYEDDWIFNKEIVKSMIASSLGIYKEKIFARKCEIREVSIKEAKEFLIKNHLNGFAQNKYRYGLYYENELVMIACFGKSRRCDDVELIRICSKLNTQIIGGFSKLIHYFKNKNPQFNRLISFINRNVFNGDGYLSSGFVIENYSKPSYWWVKQLKRFNRENFQKKKLSKILTNYDENLTEVENMHNNNYYRLFNCGTIKVVFDLSKLGLKLFQKENKII